MFLFILKINKKKKMNCEEKNKIGKSLDDLPSVIIKLVCHSYLDFDSILQFSSINRKYRSLFSDYRLANFHLNQSGFIQKWKIDESENLSKKEKLKEFILKKKLSQLIAKNNQNVLHCACFGEEVSLDTIKFFVEHKIDVNQQDNTGNTPLQIACKRLPLEYIKYFVDKKANLNLVNVYGEIAIHEACRKKDYSIETVKFLIDCKSDLNIKSRYCQDTPLFLACNNKAISLDFIKLLVESKSDLNFQQNNHKTPLHYACENVNVSLDILKYMIQKKADINVRLKSLFKTPLDLASQNTNLKKKMKEKYGETGDLKEIFKNF